MVLRGHQVAAAVAVAVVVVVVVVVVAEAAVVVDSNLVGYKDIGYTDHSQDIEDIVAVVVAVVVVVVVGVGVVEDNSHPLLPKISELCEKIPKKVERSVLVDQSKLVRLDYRCQCCIRIDQLHFG